MLTSSNPDYGKFETENFTNFFQYRHILRIFYGI